MEALRIGVLGAARIVPKALVKPARKVPGVEVIAVAARDPQKARAFADKYRIPRVIESYEALVNDPEIDAVYNPLPNGLHGRWTMAAIGAGKHVLCEKPFTANAVEAEQVAVAATASGLVVVEAFHYRYHPLAIRLKEIIDSGELGAIRRIEIAFSAPIAKRGDIRYNLDLAGGATMDMGCYAVNLLRHLGGEPTVVRAKAKKSSVGVDRAMRAEFTLSRGGSAEIKCSMFSSSLLRLHTSVVGDKGELSVFNPFAPQFLHRVHVRSATGRRTERFSRRPTYEFQLEAFRRAVQEQGPIITPPDDAVRNMAVIDAIYTASGLGVRQPTR